MAVSLVEISGANLDPRRWMSNRIMEIMIISPDAVPQIRRIIRFPQGSGVAMPGRSIDDSPSPLQSNRESLNPCHFPNDRNTLTTNILPHRACFGRTHERTHPDVTIQACWDSDRLDLGRVGITPHSSRRCTEFAKRPETVRWADGRARFRMVPEFVQSEWGVDLGSIR